MVPVLVIVASPGAALYPFNTNVSKLARSDLSPSITGDCFSPKHFGSTVPHFTGPLAACNIGVVVSCVQYKLAGCNIGLVVSCVQYRFGVGNMALAACNISLVVMVHRTGIELGRFRFDFLAENKFHFIFSETK